MIVFPAPKYVRKLSNELLSDRLGVHRNTIRNWIKTVDIKYYRFKGCRTARCFCLLECLNKGLIRCNVVTLAKADAFLTELRLEELCRNPNYFCRSNDSDDDEDTHTLH